MDSAYKKILIIISILSLHTLGASAQYDTVFAQPGPAQYEVLNALIRSIDDSAKNFEVANALLHAAQHTKSERNNISVEMMILVLDQRWHVDLPHLTEKAFALIDRAKQIDDEPVITFIYELLGDYNYINTHNESLAFEYYLKAYNNYHNLYTKELPDMTNSQYALSIAYYKFYDYQNALKYSKELIGNNFSKQPWLAILVNDLVGMSYLKMEQYDSAITYFQKTKELAPGHHQPELALAWKGIAMGNIGITLYQQKKYDMAIPNLVQGEELCLQGGVVDNAASFSVYLTNIYLASNNLPEARKYLDIAILATKRSNDVQNYCELYNALFSYYRQANNPQLAFKYLDSSVVFKDSLAVIKDVNKKYKAEIFIADEQRNMKEQLVEKEKQKQILLRNGLIIFVLMGMLFILLFYNRKLLKQRYHREQLQAEKQIAEAELNNVLQQLDNYRNNITEKNELIAILEKEVSSQADANTLAILQQSTILTDEQWNNFRLLFEKAHPGFLQKLKERLPDLTPSETRFFVLLKLNFTNKEMASALGVGAEAIRITWYRIRKKLNLPDEGGIEELVKTI